MKTELRLSNHAITPDAQVIEIWWMGRLIGEITGADGPGVRVISKYPLETSRPLHPVALRINYVEVTMLGEGGGGT